MSGFGIQAEDDDRLSMGSGMSDRLVSTTAAPIRVDSGVSEDKYFKPKLSTKNQHRPEQQVTLEQVDLVRIEIMKSEYRGSIKTYAWICLIILCCA